MTLLDYARDMRRHATPAERALWNALKTRQLGVKWRRQVPLGRYIADFYCAQAKLILEVDGGTHADTLVDEERDRWMAAEGKRVLRVWNNDVMGNLAGVLEVIAAAVATPPTAPPARGGGK